MRTFLFSGNIKIKYRVNTHQLISTGNDLRSNDRYHEALSHYAQAFVADPENPHAWNNYGNVLREIGEPKRAYPFLQHAIALDPNFVTAQFNLAIAALLAEDYKLGWQQYEWRWRYEHLADTLPKLSKPRWTGQDLKDKTILITGEQGFGDNIQFIRFFELLANQGAKIVFCTLPGIVPLIENSAILSKVITSYENYQDYDFWSPIMSLPLYLNVLYNNLSHNLQYIGASSQIITHWHQLLGPKTKLRIGICWSGRKDNWVNKYKSVPINYFNDLVAQNPNYEWISLQAEPTEEETISLNPNIKKFDGQIQNWADTAGLVHHLDLVISVDTSVAHLAGAMGRPTWIPLTKFAVDWRWGLNSNTTKWYPSVTLFRQSNFGDWPSVFEQISKFLSWYKT